MTTAHNRPLLAVDNLAVRLGTTDAVRDVSFTVQAGEIVGIVGESGSGKSVACRAILGLLPEHAEVSGRVELDGRDITGLDAKAMRAIRGQQMAMIFQNPASHLDPLMRIGRQIAEPLRQHFGRGNRQARSEAVQLLRDVQIREPEQRVDAFPHELSGGMKQRAMIASGVACAPRLLLADEPTTALDVTVQARILDLLRQMSTERELSIILVSHDLGVIAEICDKVVVMRNGEVVEAGPTRDIIDRPQQPYTRLLIDSQPSRLIRHAQQQPARTPANKGQPILEVDRLSVTFGGSRYIWQPGTRIGGFRAVDNASFDVREGETLGIVGESGSGKSTMARAIVRLLEPSAGDIRFRGQSVLDLKGADLTQYRRAVQMAFQNPFDSLNPRMTVERIVAEPIIRHGLVSRREAGRHVRELLELVEFPLELAGRRPRQLSGGQCQRVGIARALALDPEVLIADEITSALDVTIQAQILDLLRDLRRKKNLTIIFISHDLSVVRAFCDRVVVFQSGKRVEFDDVARVFDHPQTEYTQTLLDSVPLMDPA